MDTQTQTSVQKKKIPGWAKLLIVLAILGVLGLTIIGIGLRLIAGMFASKSTQYLTEQGVKHGIEAIVEHGMKEAGMAEQPKVNLTDNGLQIKDEKTGQQINIEADKKLPATFPTDIPVFQPSQVQGSMVMGPMTMVTFDTPSPVSDVSNYYQKELPTNGWQSVFAAPASADSYSGLFRKGNTALTISANRDGEKTSLILSYGSEPQQPTQP